MNYYEHHIGDYIKATAHLSMLEDAAYRRLIDAYYTRESPLPADRKACYKQARAMTRDERQAVDYVLEEFFTLEDDGWHQSRCDEELGKYREKRPAAEAKKLAARERQHRARERRKALFEKLRERGISMPWDATTEQLEHAIYECDMRSSNTPVTPPVTRDVTATQSPVTNPQIKKTGGSSNNVEGVTGDVPPLPAPSVSSPTRNGAIAVLLRNLEKARGIACRITSSDPRLVQWAADGVTDAQLQEAYELATADRDLSDKPKQAINAGFLQVFLDKVLNPPAVTAGTSRPRTGATQRPWFLTASSIEAKASELGYTPPRDVPTGVWKFDLFKLAGVTREEYERAEKDFR